MVMEVKRCACCGATFDAAAWAKLEHKGWCGRADTESRTTLELRQCPRPCGNTLAVEVERGPLPAEGEGGPLAVLVGDGKPSLEDLEHRAIHADHEGERISGDFAGPAPAADPAADPKPLRTCNRHKDCDEADRAVAAKGRTLWADHCHDEDCEDCFGS